jgi:hypothetical protein
MRLRRVISALALASMAACGADEQLQPAPTEAPTTPVANSSTGSGPTNTGGGPAGTSTRTVMQRNPYGNVAAVNNLLWDGDFEWYTRFASQYGWWTLASPNAFSLINPDIQIGARCRSGIKCAAMADNAVMMGMAVAWEGKELQISFWANTSGEACGGITAYLLSRESSEPDLEIEAPAGPEADGWCHFDSALPERKSAQFLYIHNDSGVEVVLDDVVIQPSMVDALRLSAGTKPVPKAQLASAHAWFDVISKPSDPVPTEAQRFVEDEGRQWRN